MPREGIETRFSYKGFNFRVNSLVQSFAETNEEAQKKFKQTFDMYGGEIVSMVDGEVVVSWREYFDKARGRSGEFMRMTYIRILYALGILSFQAENNWVVIHDNSVVTPSVQDGFTKQYFTRRQDAIEYVKASKVRGGSLMIFRTDEIIPKEELERA